MSKLGKHSLSILIPCYNEVDGIPNLFDKLTAALPDVRDRWEVEIVFVDDGSTDGTADAIRENFSDLAPEVVVHPENRNLGAALRTGFAATSGEVVAVLDSDCTYDPQVLLPMLKLLDDGADLVTASPYHPDGHVGGVPGYRLFLSKSLAWVLRVVMGTDNRTFSAMVRVYRREVIDRIPVRHDNFVAQTQTMCEAIMNGYRVVDYPTTLAVRQFGTSKMRVMSVIQAQALFVIALAPKALGWRIRKLFRR